MPVKGKTVPDEIETDEPNQTTESAAPSYEELLATIAYLTEVVEKATSAPQRLPRSEEVQDERLTVGDLISRSRPRYEVGPMQYRDDDRVRLVEDSHKGCKSREWLMEKGVMTAEDSLSYRPNPLLPRLRTRRPQVPGSISRAWKGQLFGE